MLQWLSAAVELEHQEDRAPVRIIHALGLARVGRWQRWRPEQLVRDIDQIDAGDAPGPASASNSPPRPSPRPPPGRHRDACAPSIRSMPATRPPSASNSLPPGRAAALDHVL
jgi:hypothetical protein